MILAGVNTQTLTIPAETIGYLNVNLTGTSPVLNVVGGNLTVSGSLGLNNGVVVIPSGNNIVLTGAEGFTKNAANLSHIVGSVQKAIASASSGRYEFPVGTLTAYRLAYYI